MAIQMAPLIIVTFILGLACSTYGQTAVNGNWGAWSAYGSCSVTCGNGEYSRTRQCDNPAPSNGGTNCAGSASETASCWTSTCYPSQLGNLDKNCGANAYGCFSGSVTCVDSSKRCDRVLDCSDGSDEDATHAGCFTCSGAGSVVMSVFSVVCLFVASKLLKM